MILCQRTKSVLLETMLLVNITLSPIDKHKDKLSDHDQKIRVENNGTYNKNNKKHLKYSLLSEKLYHVYCTLGFFELCCLQDRSISILPDSLDSF